tara:strand:+ start:615 stop:839 length:225 start_codon:yes stop_codon:yes gene_type:complete
MQQITIHNHSSGWQTLLNGAHISTHATQEEAICQVGFLVNHELGHAVQIDCRGDHGTLKVTIETPENNYSMVSD